MNKTEKSSIDSPENPEIPISNRILKELNIIDKIFNAQLFKIDGTVFLPYLLKSNGNIRIERNYFNTLDIFSNIELFKLQDYIIEYTNRYENTSNDLILKNITINKNN